MSYFFTKDEEMYLIEHYPHEITKDIAEHLGRSIPSIHAKAKHLKLHKTIQFYRQKNDRNGSINRIKEFSFKKGQKAWNKGKKFPKYYHYKGKDTRFKKGQVPNNRKPIGYERINKDGTIDIKIDEKKGFESKQRVFWSKHYGAIPEGMMISFIDGNPQNCDISNLKLITRAEHMKNNSIMNYPKELRKAIHTLSNLNKNIKKYEQNKH